MFTHIWFHFHLLHSSYAYKNTVSHCYMARSIPFSYGLYVCMRIVVSSICHSKQILSLYFLNFLLNIGALCGGCCFISQI